MRMKTAIDLEAVNATDKVEKQPLKEQTKAPKEEEVLARVSPSISLVL